MEAEETRLMEQLLQKLSQRDLSGETTILRHFAQRSTCLHKMSHKSEILRCSSRRKTTFPVSIVSLFDIVRGALPTVRDARSIPTCQ